MIKQDDKITVFQMMMFIMMVTGLQNHVIAIDPLISTAGRDGWLSILFTTILTVIWSILILYIQKGMNQEHIYTWLKQQIGKPIAVLICTVIYIYCFLLATITVRETVAWTKITYLQETPILFLVLTLLFLCILAVFTTIRTLAIATVFLLFFVVILGFFVAIANLQVKDYALLFPILEHGYDPVIKGMIYPGAGMGEIILFIFLQHKYKNKVRYRNIFWIVIILALLTAGPYIGGITEFGPTEAANQRFTPFEEWGLVTVSRYIEHVDFLSIYQWLSGAFIRISFLIFIALEVFKIKKRKVRISLLLLMGFIMLIASIYPISYIVYFDIMKMYLLPTLLIMSLSLSLILAGIVLIANIRKKRGQAR